MMSSIKTTMKYDPTLKPSRSTRILLVIVFFLRQTISGIQSGDMNVKANKLDRSVFELSTKTNTAAKTKHTYGSVTKLTNRNIIFRAIDSRSGIRGAFGTA